MAHEEARTLERASIKAGIFYGNRVLRGAGVGNDGYFRWLLGGFPFSR